MIISINGEMISLPANIITVADLTKWRNIPEKGTAIAINGKIVKTEQRSATKLQDNDSVMIISAAYGG